MRRIEPIFNLQTPLLFAHRGGAWEAPESTVKGFTHAIKKAKADVLEVDVQLTRDGEFVIWHGPDLHNVRIEGQSDRPLERTREKIYHYDWDELNEKAWVADPEVKRLKAKDRDLSTVPQGEDRCLLLLSDFLATFPDIPLNIEMKKSFKRKFNDTSRRGLEDNIRAFTEILDNDPGHRTIAIVSSFDDYIDEFREINGEEKFPTALSFREQLFYNVIGHLVGKDMTNHALETSYDENLSSKIIVKKTRELGGSTFVFLTGFGFLLPAIDKKIPSDQQIFDILNRGVDGIMTDRPESVREIMNRWSP